MLSLLLDCDGVLANFTGYVCDHLGIEVSEVTTYAYFNRTPFADRFHALCEGEELWRNLRPMPGARKAVEQLRQAQIPLIVATAPWHSNWKWGGIRYWWLKHHFDISPAHVLVGAHKELINGIGLVEDRAPTLRKWGDAHEGRGLFLFDQPYNQEQEDRWVRGTWATGLADRILERYAL